MRAGEKQNIPPLYHMPQFFPATMLLYSNLAVIAVTAIGQKFTVRRSVSAYYVQVLYVAGFAYFPTDFPWLIACVLGLVHALLPFFPTWHREDV